MRDDFQIPNMGTAEDKYDQSFLRRMVRNVEQTFTSLRAKGPIQVSDLTADTATAGNLTLTNPLPVASGGTGAPTAAGARTNLDAQQQWPNLDAIGPLASAADTMPYFTGSGTAALTPITSYARTLVDDTTSQAARNTLELPMRVWTRTFTSTTSETFLDWAVPGTPKSVDLDIYCASVSTAATVTVQFSTDNGATWKTGVNDYTNKLMYTNNGVSTAQATADVNQTSSHIIGNFAPLAASHNFGGRFRGHMMGTGTSYSIIEGVLTYYNGTNVIYATGYTYSPNNAFNAMRITANNAIKGDVVIRAYY